MVMTFVLHPLSHYNSITEPRARFLLSLLKRLTIDFPSHFIISLIDVYSNTATCDKLMFPSAIFNGHVLPFIRVTHPVVPLNKEVPVLPVSVRIKSLDTNLSDNFLGRKLYIPLDLKISEGW